MQTWRYLLRKRCCLSPLGQQNLYLDVRFADYSHTGQFAVCAVLENDLDWACTNLVHGGKCDSAVVGAVMKSCAWLRAESTILKRATTAVFLQGVDLGYEPAEHAWRKLPAPCYVVDLIFSEALSREAAHWRLRFLVKTPSDWLGTGEADKAGYVWEPVERSSTTYRVALHFGVGTVGTDPMSAVRREPISPSNPTNHWRGARSVR